LRFLFFCLRLPSDSIIVCREAGQPQDRTRLYLP
jgi:hypothetical protein